MFLVLVIIAVCLFYLLDQDSFSAPFEKPWHLQPSVHEDSLSQEYKEKYEIADKRPLRRQIGDSLQRQVHILVDAWGIPLQESLLKEDFSFFANIPSRLIIHQRLANRTKHAEYVELRNGLENNVFLFGGDSLEYNRRLYIPEIGFRKVLFCQKCSDSMMVDIIDSLLFADSASFIGWTTQSAREGNRTELHKSLRLIAECAKKHPDVPFVVQGTHRPILGMPETRRSHKAHWVPAAILNTRK